MSKPKATTESWQCASKIWHDDGQMRSSDPNKRIEQMAETIAAFAVGQVEPWRGMVERLVAWESHAFSAARSGDTAARNRGIAQDSESRCVKDFNDARALLGTSPERRVGDTPPAPTPTEGQQANEGE